MIDARLLAPQIERRCRQRELLGQRRDRLASEQPLTDLGPKAFGITLGHDYLQVAHDQILTNPVRKLGFRSRIFPRGGEFLPIRDCPGLSIVYLCYMPHHAQIMPDYCIVRPILACRHDWEVGDVYQGDKSMP